eukprot:555878-Amphidinium_carterae.1
MSHSCGMGRRETAMFHPPLLTFGILLFYVVPCDSAIQSAISSGLLLQYIMSCHDSGASMRGIKVAGVEKLIKCIIPKGSIAPVSYTHLRAHETEADL